MVDREILEAISELGESDLKRLRILIDNKLGTELHGRKRLIYQIYIIIMLI